MPNIKSKVFSITIRPRIDTFNQILPRTIPFHNFIQKIRKLSESYVIKSETGDSMEDIPNHYQLGLKLYTEKRADKLKETLLKTLPMITEAERPQFKVKIHNDYQFLIGYCLKEQTDHFKQTYQLTDDQLTTSIEHYKYKKLQEATNPKEKKYSLTKNNFLKIMKNYYLAGEYTSLTPDTFSNILKQILHNDQWQIGVINKRNITEMYQIAQLYLQPDTPHNIFFQWLKQDLVYTQEIEKYTKEILDSISPSAPTPPLGAGGGIRLQN